MGVGPADAAALVTRTMSDVSTNRVGAAGTGADTGTPTVRAGYRVRRSERARRARLTISRDGEVVVVLPRRVSLVEAERLVVRHAAWLERHLGRIQHERRVLAERPALGEGRVLQVEGAACRISTVDARIARPARGRVEPVDGGLIVRLGRDGRTSAELVERWFRRQAREVITERVAARAADVGVRPGRLTIRDGSSRWASASGRGSLSFSWRLLLAPPFVLDAVVVHELAHLRIRGHSRPFWDLVERHAPRTPEARRWLREHAAELRAALD